VAPHVTGVAAFQLVVVVRHVPDYGEHLQQSLQPDWQDSERPFRILNKYFVFLESREIHILHVDNMIPI